MIGHAPTTKNTRPATKPIPPTSDITTKKPVLDSPTVTVPKGSGLGDVSVI